MSVTPAHCESCGRELVDGRCSKCADRAVSKIVRRDLMRLLLLSLTAILCFLGTRALARIDRRMSDRTAESWYQSGLQAMQMGKGTAAVDYFRRATANDNRNPQYILALAEALASDGEDDEARQLLLRIRENSPEDPEINWQIARVEAKRGEVADAELYYHHALYGLWRGTDSAARRREIRLELVRFMIQHNQRSEALSELLALQSEAPTDDGLAITIGGLDLQLGDPARARTLFEQALRSDRKSVAALSGLAQADYRLGRFAAATRSVQAVAAQNSTLPPEIQRLQEILKWIVDHDPTRRGLSREERYSRLSADLILPQQRLENCLSGKLSNEANRPSLVSMQTELLNFQKNLEAQKTAKQDDILDGLSLIARAEDLAAKTCSAGGSEWDEALTSMTKAAGAGER